jgi:hypothetical protein
VAAQADTEHHLTALQAMGLAGNLSGIVGKPLVEATNLWRMFVDTRLHCVSTRQAAENSRFSSIGVWLPLLKSRILNDGRSLFCAEMEIQAASP